MLEVLCYFSNFKISMAVTRAYRIFASQDNNRTKLPTVNIQGFPQGFLRETPPPPKKKKNYPNIFLSDF